MPLLFLLLAGCNLLLPLSQKADGQPPHGDGAALDGAGGDGTSGDGDGAPGDGQRIDGGKPGPPPLYKVTGDGWSVRHPLFRTGSHLDIFAVWGSGPNDIWVAGEEGRVIRNVGHGWREVETNTTETLSGVWGAAGRVWIVGSKGTVLHFDGSAPLAPVAVNTTADLLSVHGTSASSVWIGAANALALHLNPSGGWDQQSTSSYLDTYKIHVGSSGEVWVPDTGQLRSYQGGSWIPEELPTAGAVRSLTGTAARVTVAATSNGDVVAFDGSSWSARPYSLPGAIQDLYLDPGGTVWGAGKGGVFRLDDTAATNVWPPSSTPDLLAIWGTGGGEIYSVGYGAQMAYHDGKRWRAVSLASRYWTLDVATRPGETWVVAADMVLRETGRGFLEVPWQGTLKTLRGVWVGGPGEAWAVGEGGVAGYYDPVNDVMVGTTTNVTGKLRRVTGFAGGPVWACGEDGILTYSAGAWSPPAATGDCNAIWARTTSDIWTVGWGGAVNRWNGSTTASLKTSISEDLYGIDGTSASDVWVVGDKGLAAHYDGTAWKASTVPGASGILYSVWIGPKAVWVAGDDGVFVLRSGSGGWIEQDIGTTYGMESITGTSDTDVWACGEEGYVVHFDDSK